MIGNTTANNIQLPRLQYDGELTLAVGKSRMEKEWKHRQMTWGQLIEKLSQTTRTRETLAEYDAMVKSEQDSLKDVGGFVGGTLSGGRRTAQGIKWRSVLTLDADFAGPDFWETFVLWNDYAALIYSTHKHRPAKPRFRLVIPLKRPVTPDEYQALSRKVAQGIGMDLFDDTTYQPARLMYWPSTSADGEFLFHLQDGPWLDPDEVLARYGTDEAWKDQSLWPESGRTVSTRKKLADKQGDPLTKPGMVGLFCRTYSIHDAIADFLSDVYVPTDKEDRYTYAAGSSAAGLVIYENVFAYSNHGTDPISGKLVNAFDLIRLHHFGDMDEKAGAGTPTVKLPSYLAMIALAKEDEQVKQLLDAERIESAKLDFNDSEFNPVKAFFDEKRFIPKYLADWFLIRHQSFNMNDDLYVYQGGRYVYGENIFYKEATTALREEFLGKRVAEALAYLKNTLEQIAPDEAASMGPYINCRNGLLRLDTFELRPHTPELKTVIQLPVDYDPDAVCPAYDQYVQFVAPGSVETIEELMGNCLKEGMEYEKAVLLHGDGGNGKGTLIAIIQRLLGDSNVSNVPLQTLSENRFAGAELFGKLANLYADLPNRLIEDSSLFKTLVSGDSIMAERKHKQPFNFRNRAKLIFSTNELSSSKDNTEGFFRRWIVIPFYVKFNDRDLRQRLFSEAEMSGILRRALIGLKRLQDRGEFTVPETVKELSQSYREKSDSVFRFLNERCRLGGNSDLVGKQQLYDAYRAFCHEWGNNPVTQANFNVRLKNAYANITEYKKEPPRKWRGIILNEHDFLA